MAPHSCTHAWKIPWMEEPGRLQSMGSLRVGHDWATSLSLFTFMHWHPTPAFLSGESQGQRSLVGCHLWGCIDLDMTALLTMPKPLTMWITINCGKFWKTWEYQTTRPASWETCMLTCNLYAGQEATVRTGHGTTDWFQIGKGVHQDCILSPWLHHENIVSTSWEILGWKKHKLESRLLEEISITSNRQMTPPVWQKVKNWRASWWKWKRKVKKLA